MSKFTPQQIVEILSTPIGRDYGSDDEAVLAERKKIDAKCSELRSAPRWFSAEELSGTWAGAQHPDGAHLIPDFTECSIEARAWWLRGNVLDA